MGAGSPCEQRGIPRDAGGSWGARGHCGTPTRPPSAGAAPGAGAELGSGVFGHCPGRRRVCRGFGWRRSVPVGTGHPAPRHRHPARPSGQAQTQRPSPGHCWPGGLAVGILGRAGLAGDGGFAQHRCCRCLLPSPAARPSEASGCDAMQARGHRHPLSVRLSARGPVHRVSPSFHCSNNLFSTLGAKASPLAPARASIFSCLQASTFPYIGEAKRISHSHY